MEIKNYYVVFSEEREVNQWYHRFLKKPFWHCFILYEIRIKKQMYCIRIDCNKSRAFVEILDLSGDNILALLRNYQKLVVDKGFLTPKILQWKKKIDNNTNLMDIRNMIPTCATLVKSFLGIRCFAFTPYMLYKYMRKMRCIELI